MIYLKWVAFAPLSIIAKLVNYPLAPLIVLFANKEGYLPAWLNWFQTYDSSLDGDSNFKRNVAGENRYFNRVRWLWRNSMYGFERDVLGATTLSARRQVSGDIRTSDMPYHPGWVFKTSNEGLFFLYIIAPMPFNKCLRIMVGWKMFKNTAGPHQYAVYFNPFKSRQ